MELSFNQFFGESNDNWQKIMDQLMDLRDWQRMEEEVVRKRQLKQIDSLTQQNTKLNVLSNTPSTDDNHTNGSTDKFVHNQCQQMNDISLERQSDNCFDNSLEEFRTYEKSCQQSHETSDEEVFKNNSYLENSPVKPGINGKEVKTFEELLNIKLKKDKNNDFIANQNKPKKPFLRKGEGIKRFEGNKSQTNVSSNDNQKISFKTNDTKIVSTKTRPKAVTKPHYSVKEFVNKKKFNKSEDNYTKPKRFIRKVIPMTTKFNKIDKNSVQITRDTPTVIIDGLNETESELFDYLREIYENISIEDNSIDHKFRNKDINELQDLLKKIETKREIIEKQFDSNSSENKENFSFDCQQLRTKHKTKKKVHWSHIQGSSDEESDETHNNDLIEPKAGAYSSQLRQQINELEEQLLRLKNIKKDKLIDSSVAKDKENTANREPINEELIKLGKQIEKLSERIVNIESKAYDMSSSQLKDLSNRKNTTNFVERNRKTFSKTICSPPIGPNVLVNDVSKDTTIEFPNGDKMTVSKDNTIFYNFANGTTQTTYPDGFKITHFPNGQTEKMDRNGVKRITYPNGLQRIINPDSSEEVLMTDGTVWRIHSDGSEVLEFPDGDREIRTNKYKRREYRNGNIKTLYSDGTEETRYISGRLRIKDKFGNLMVDSKPKHLDQHFVT